MHAYPGLILSLIWLLGGGCRPESPAARLARQLEGVIPERAKPTGNVRSFDIEAAEAELPLIQGGKLRVWAYSGRVPGPTPVTEWSETRNVRWSTDVGRSYSSPIVTDKFVFVTSEPNLLFCLDRTSGKVLWKVEIKPADLTDANSRSSVEKYDPPHDGSGLAAATPLTDGRSVYVVLANGLVGAVDLDG